MTYLLGVDIGSVNAKLALLDADSNIIHCDVEKITSGPKVAITSLISRLRSKFNIEDIASAGISGSGKAVIPKELDWAEYSSPLSIAAGLIHHHPDARTIISIGGQSSLVLVLEDGLKKPWKVVSNPLCAAGTGRFMEQQAYRLGISMDDFARLALQCQGSPPRIAARCSVFAKTDLIHLQQKGVPLETMLYALCESIARMVTSLKQGSFEAPIYFVGGVAANAAVVRALNEVLATKNRSPVEVTVPKYYLHTEAIGSALLATGKRVQGILLPEGDVRQHYFQLPRLEPVSQHDGDSNRRIDKHYIGYLGVDVGSTSTKAVILDETGKVVLAKHYLMTAGKPIDAVKEVFRNLICYGAGNVTIAGAGVTGSGRYLIGSLIGADLIKNEITAQTRAAAEIDPEADIIEIGGQDSKLVIKRQDVVVDYQMNKACAAGTGSFIDELAEMLNVSVKSGEFADLAFEAPSTIDLGTRCAAFMGQAVASAQQEGVSQQVITASLANAIAKNYLSKVVGNRKLGSKVILTGAVFYNHAVVSAFKQQLKGKTLTVPEHKEVSGAIGAALLSKETMASGKSKFKGFKQIIDSECQLSTFICKSCDNNCTITRMQVPNKKPTFYGSRCDRYDSTLSQEKIATFFDEREKLLFRDYHENSGKGPVVGIPRALLVYDYAPLLIGFLNALDVNVILSSKTTKEIMEKSVELSYADCCFPVKLLHGHAASLSSADFILYPCAIRLGEKEGQENQKYACPLVQASPFIIRQVLGLEERLLIPTIDFSRGNEDVVRNLTHCAVKMGFNKEKGKQAALDGISAQQQFESDKTVLGKKILEQLYNSSKLGVVIIARSYMSQDAGANLGIAEKLAQLGVIPIPLDFLPLNSIAATDYSDRPYWLYESKHIAAAAIAKSNPQLYGLILTNFGCGPNSFILKMLEDIMGGKPLGQLEIDEHAAEAGIVTRLEAFVDTIEGFAHAGKKPEGQQKNIYRGASAAIDTQKTLLIPRMAPHAEAVAAAMEACGVSAMVLPEPDDRNLFYSEQVTSGTECLPYRVTLGDFMRFYYENGAHHRNYEGFNAGSYGPCRLGKYAIEQIRLLKDIGFDLPIRTTVSNNAYRDLNLGPDFERIAWRGIVAVDCLEKMVWRTRPYEKEKGEADKLFATFVTRVADRIRRKEVFADVMKEATIQFKTLIDARLPRRPLIGINGEIYLRSNKFSNKNLVKVCEDAGLEVMVTPMGEWFKYTSYRNFEDAVIDRELKKMLVSYIKKHVQAYDEHSVAIQCKQLLDTHEPSTSELLELTSRYLSPKCGSEAVLSIGCGIKWLEDSSFAGAISVMPHGCMPGGIVAAMAEKFSSIYHKPWISLTYDGFMETNNLAKINSFAEIIRYCNK
jgi:predicted CoA-substrate-specific enzyme activase